MACDVIKGCLDHLELAFVAVKEEQGRVGLLKEGFQVVKGRRPNNIWSFSDKRALDDEFNHLFLQVFSILDYRKIFEVTDVVSPPYSEPKLLADIEV